MAEMDNIKKKKAGNICIVSFQLIMTRKQIMGDLWWSALQRNTELYSPDRTFLLSGTKKLSQTLTVTGLAHMWKCKHIIYCE